MQLGTAFIELLPDLSGFAKKTNDDLKKAAPKPVEVGVKADLGTVAKDIATGVGKITTNPVSFPVYADFQDASAAAKKAGGDAGAEFSREFDKTTESSSGAGAGLDAVATKADGLATRASTAAGGIGDLAGALAANGIISEEMAGKAELAASSIMGVAGVADLSVIAMEGVKALQASDIIQKGVLIGQNIAMRTVQIASTIATGAQAAAQWALNAAMSANPIGIVIAVLALLVGAIILAYNKSETFRNIVQAAWRGIQNGVSFAWNKVIRPILDAVVYFFTVVVPGAAGRLLEANDRIFQAVSGVIRGFGDTVSTIVNRIVGFFTKTVPNAFNTFRDRGVAAVRDLRDKLGGFFDGIKKLAVIPVNFVIEKIYNDGIRTLVNKVIGVFGGSELPPMEPIKLASGGVLPGWSPGRDVHQFFSPTGGRLALSGGEAVMRPEFTRMVGGLAGVNALNAASRAGNGMAVAALLGAGQHHAEGGLVGYKGGTFTEGYAAVLRQLNSVVPFNLFQGGFRPTTSYSGTSHAGDAADIGPVSAALVQAARALGNAAWDRTGMGNWAPHIHMVPLPGVGRAGGQGVWQAQDYLSGGNGLGGRDNGLGSGSQPDVTAGGFNPLKIVDLIASVPGVLRNIQDGFTQMVSDTGLGRILRDTVRGVMNNGVTWVNDKIPGDGPLPGFATGGVAVKGGWARVGERGAETVWLPGGARVAPNGGALRLVGGTVELDMTRSEAHLRLLIADENGHEADFSAMTDSMSRR
jgi:hypothetical protein